MKAFILLTILLPLVAGTLKLRAALNTSGYNLEEHLVITDDGYVLQLDRAVPKQRNYDDNFQRFPVIVFHGLFTDSVTFFLGKSTDAKKCGVNLGSCLLGNNFIDTENATLDVWLPNARGNGRSHLHLDYSMDDSKFWKFSLEEIALYDLRAVIDFVLLKTGAESVGFIGYSQGASAMFALLSTIPSYRALVRPIIAWAPTVYTHSSPTILKRILQPFKPTLLSDCGQFPLSRALLNWISGSYIPSGSLLQFTNRLIFGPTLNLNESSKFYEYLSHRPASVSNWQIAHFLQLWNSPDTQFRSLDLSVPARRGRTFDLKKIRQNHESKIVIFYGANDYFVSPKDVERLVRELRASGNDVISEKINNFNHIDFVFGTNAGINRKTRQYLLNQMSA